MASTYISITKGYLYTRCMRITTPHLHHGRPPALLKRHCEAAHHQRGTHWRPTAPRGLLRVHPSTPTFVVASQKSCCSGCAQLHAGHLPQLLYCELWVSHYDFPASSCMHGACVKLLPATSGAAIALWAEPHQERGGCAGPARVREGKQRQSCSARLPPRPAAWPPARSPPPGCTPPGRRRQSPPCACPAGRVACMRGQQLVCLIVLCQGCLMPRMPLPSTLQAAGCCCMLGGDVLFTAQ